MGVSDLRFLAGYGIAPGNLVLIQNDSLYQNSLASVTIYFSGFMSSTETKRRWNFTTALLRSLLQCRLSLRGLGLISRLEMTTSRYPEVVVVVIILLLYSTSRETCQL